MYYFLFLLFLPSVLCDSFNHATIISKVTLWTTFSIFALTSCVFFIYLITLHPNFRFYNYLTFSICAFACLFYYCMALNVGIIEINGREIYILRYVDWLFTTPLLLTTLASLASINNTNIYILIALDILMVISGILGTVYTDYRMWCLFAISNVFFMPIIYFLYEDFELRKLEYSYKYKKLGYFLTGFWLMYPFVWIIANTHVVSVDTEVIMYAFLDISAKCVFCSWLLSLEPYKQDTLFIESKENDELKLRTVYNEFKSSTI